MDKAVQGKGEREYIKGKNKKNKRWTEDMIEALEDRLVRRMQGIQQESKRDYLKVESALQENEKKTLWKIKDCESLLLNRVNEEFVDKAIKTMNGKVEREVTMAVDSRLTEVMAMIEQ